VFPDAASIYGARLHPPRRLRAAPVHRTTSCCLHPPPPLGIHPGRALERRHPPSEPVRVRTAGVTIEAHTHGRYRV
jgi:hypothetical protein